jgi:catechol 2,3-dioxygenase-like lactoylglutathione lyase family enzyme
VPVPDSSNPNDAGITGIASVVIPVADQSRALKFYRDVLGLQTRQDVTYGADVRWLEVAPPGSPTTLALVPPRGGMWESVGIDTRVSLFSDALENEHTRLLDLGVDADQQILRLGPAIPAMFRFRDPDGNTLQIVERIAGEDHHRGP